MFQYLHTAELYHTAQTLLKIQYYVLLAKKFPSKRILKTGCFSLLSTDHENIMNKAEAKKKDVVSYYTTGNKNARWKD
jgi:hypothetical protein